MGNLKWLTTIVAMVWMTVFIGSCSVEEPIVESFDGVELVSSSDTAPEFLLHFTIENPNRKPIIMDTANLDILVNKVKLGEAHLIEPGVIPEKGTHKVSMKVRLDMEKSLLETAALLGMAILADDLHFQIQGDAKGAMGWMKTSVPLDYQTKVSWDDLNKMIQ